MSASIAIFLVPLTVGALAYASWKHNKFGVNQRKPRVRFVKVRTIDKPNPNARLIQYPYYLPGQEPRLEPRPTEYKRPEVQIIRQSTNTKKARKTHDIESQVRAVFTRFNPDIDPEGIDWNAVIDHNLSARENIAQFRRNDNQFSVFKWND